MLAASCGGDDDPALSTTVPTSTPGEPGVADSEPDPSAADNVDTVELGEPGDDEAREDGEAQTEGSEDDDAAAAAPGGGTAVPTPTQVPTTGEPDFTTVSKLSTVGLDTVFFGDTVEDAAERGDIEWIGLPEPGSVPQCYTVQTSGGPAGIVFTVIDNHIERVDITNPAITTVSGAGVGSTEVQLFDLFGDRLEEAESGDGSAIAFVPADVEDQDFRIIWITDGVAATSMRAGRIPGVLTDAPCG